VSDFVLILCRQINMSQLLHLKEPYASLFRIQRALAGYVSYLAACDVNVNFTEYILYEPILRVLMTQKFKVNCEVSCTKILKNDKDAHLKRIDFVAKKRKLCFALEVKWAGPKKRNRARNVVNRTLNVEKDHEKLEAFHQKYPDSNSFLCVFGTYNNINKIRLSPDSFTEPNGVTTKLPPIYASFKKTQYGCRIYELTSP